MIIECPTCEARVDATTLAEKEYPPDDNNEPRKYVFLECPSCKNVLLGYSEWHSEEDYNNWDRPSRLWPEPEYVLPKTIPTSVRQSLHDAIKCFKCGVYSATAVLCGRAIEAICRQALRKKVMLGKGLKELKDKKIIDERLYEWGEALRDERNISAHPTEDIDSIGREDAKDLLDFSMAIAEYVYVLSVRFARYKDRKKERKFTT